MPTLKRNQTGLSYGLLVCAIAGAFYAYEFLLRVLPGALQTELMHAFGGISAGLFGQIVSLYYFAYSPMQLPVGVLMDRYGPRAVLSFSCLLCALGSALFSQTDSLWMVSVGRFLIGFGSAFAFVGILFLGHHWLPRRYFSLLAGLVTTFAMFTLMFGVVKLTVLSETWGLNNILFYLTVAGFLLSGFIYLLVRDAPNNQVVLQKKPWKDFLKEVRLVLTEKDVWLVGVIGALMYTALSVFGELWGKVYLQQAHHLTSMQAAQSISCVFLGWALGAPIVGYVSDRSGQRRMILLLASFIGALSIAWVLYAESLSWHTINALLFVYGVATSTEIIVFVMGKEMSKASLAGTVFAAVNMIVMLGGVILQPVVGYLLDWSAHGKIVRTSSIDLYSVLDYQIALSFLPLSLLGVMLLLWWFRARFK